MEAAQAESIAHDGRLEMTGVAARAGASVGLAYHHCGSKTGLIAAIVERFSIPLPSTARQPLRTTSFTVTSTARLPGIEEITRPTKDPGFSQLRATTDTIIHLGWGDVVSQLLLFVLLPIALLDSLTMVPLCVVPFGVLLGGARPYLGSAALIGGIFAVYAVAGVLVLLGLDAVADSLAPVLSRWWNRPHTLELVLQLLAGLVLLGLGWRIASARSGPQERSSPQTLSPPRAFGLGAGLTLAGLPGAVPYFGAIDQIVRADLPRAASAIALLFYNLAFLLPIAALALVPLLLPEQSEEISRRIASFSDRWGHRIVSGLLALVGAIFTADALGWFLGVPLLPVEPQG